jgi:hypothetical protein
MPSEFWLVLTVAAAFLLLGIAGSPLAWLVLYHRRSRLEIAMDRKYQYLFVQLKELEGRILQQESAGSDDRRLQSPSAGRVSMRADSPAETIGRVKSPWWRTPTVGAKDPGEHALIAVPSLEPAHSDRGVTMNGLKERYAAIWALADKGATLEQMARATGQPIGQIELILGLRRQIDGPSTRIPHAPHA